MELLEYLDNYKGAALGAMTRARGVYPGSPGHDRNLQALFKVVETPASVKRAYAALGLEAQMVLALLRESGGEATIRDLQVAAHSLGLAEFDVHLKNLMRHALVFYKVRCRQKVDLWNPDSTGYDAPQTSWKVFGLPAALDVAQKVNVPAAPRRLTDFEGAPAQVATQSPALVLHGLNAVLRYAVERGLTMTKAGVLAKPALRTCAKELKADQEWVTFLCALASSAGLVQSDSVKLVVQPAAANFFTWTPHVQIEQLLRAWIGLRDWSEFYRIPEITCSSNVIPDDHVYYFGYSDVPAMGQLALARSAIIGLLRRQRVEPQWYTFESLVTALHAEDADFLVPRRHKRYAFAAQSDDYAGFRPTASTAARRAFNKKTDWPLVEGRYLREVLRGPLLWFGMVEIGLDAGNEVVAWRPTPAGLRLLGLADESAAEASTATSELKPLVVQPNFEIIAYTDMEFLPVLYQLERFAARTSYDRVAHYKLTRDDAYRGLQSGMDATAIRGFLETHSRTALPQNIVYTLDDWQQQFDRVHVYRDATLVEAASEAELDAALQDVPSEVVLRLGPQWALLHGENAAAVKQRLAGIDETVTLDYSIIVQEAFTIDAKLRIFVPHAHRDMWLQSRLAQFSEFKGEDQKGVTYQLTRAAFERAVNLGLPAADILQFLQALGPRPLPVDVELTLRGWSGAYPPVALTNTIVLVGETGFMTKLAAIDELRKLIWLKVDDRTALVREDDLLKLKTALDKRGISTDAEPKSLLNALLKPRPDRVPGSFRPPHRRVESRPHAAPPGPTLHIPPTAMNAVPFYELEPSVEDDLDGIELISYSEVILMEMLEDAIDEQLCVVIDYSGKTRRVTRTVEPLEIVDEWGHDYLLAYDRLSGEMRQFRLDRIRAMAVTEERYNK